MVFVDLEFAGDNQAAVVLLGVRIQSDFQGRQVIVPRAAIYVSLFELDGTIRDQSNSPATSVEKERI